MPLGSLLCPLCLHELRAGSCECDRWRVRHSSSSKSSVASLEKSKASRTVAKFVVKHRRIMNSFDRRSSRLLEKSLSESKAPRLKDFENKKDLKGRLNVKFQVEECCCGLSR
ncbi:hypothetical protein F2Q69_00015111 [Brassica cretica]|uniref:Uncharacterized protein n=1 Tax=Brassica cretica TaxID=69181 RepID=A0A8S9R3S3_BRACR|nr:hypothetical protein F2Q69_00015111 [Brassica cretica]